ncbi:MAG TPA: AbrB/MazE/SpoVT family DNA-binding domain-containing protein [Terriglobia bacterium]
MEAAKVGKRGAIIVPARLRRRYGIEEGMLVTTEEREEGIPDPSCRGGTRGTIHP